MIHISFSPPDITEAEIQAVTEVLRSGWITTGPKTKEFEREIAHYCGTEKAACLNSATAALELTLRVLGIGEGDEVITSAYTYTASASVICHVGAKPVFVDTKKGSYEMDGAKIAAAISERTKAIIAVDLAGIPCDYEQVFSIAEEKKRLFNPKGSLQEKMGRIAVIADAAHAFGAKQGKKRSGAIADFTAFSFHAVKNLTTAEGGAVTWRAIEGMDNEELYRQYMLLSLHGQSKDALAKTKIGAWEYDIISPAYKCNMTDIMAAIGLAQLKRYPGMLARRQEIIEKYDAGLCGSDVQVLNHYGNNRESSGHLYLTRLLGKDEAYRNRFIEKLAQRGIAVNVHYKPLPLYTAYKNMGYFMDDYPNAYAMYQNEITLPLHTKLKDEEVDYIIDSFKAVQREMKA